MKTPMTTGTTAVGVRGAVGRVEGPAGVGAAADHAAERDDARRAT